MKLLDYFYIYKKIDTFRLVSNYFLCYSLSNYATFWRFIEN